MGGSGELVGLYLEGEMLRKVKGSEKEGDHGVLRSLSQFARDGASSTTPKMQTRKLPVQH